MTVPKKVNQDKPSEVQSEIKSEEEKEREEKAKREREEKERKEAEATTELNAILKRAPGMFLSPVFHFWPVSNTNNIQSSYSPNPIAPTARKPR